MDPTKSAHVFHTCIQLKHDLSHFSAQFERNPCLCFSKLHQTDVFWVGCDNALNKINRLVSMVLQMLCETNDCLCLEHMHPIIDSMYRCVQPLLLVLSENKTYWQCGMIQTVVENDALVSYLEFGAKFALDSIEKLIDVLKQCDKDHLNLLSKYNTCVLCCE